jgi:hypothetical protein
MGRKHTAGTAGGSGVGGFNIDNTTLTAADDLDITIDPSGTGIFKVAGDAQLQAQGDLRFADADNSNWVAFQGPATVVSNVTWTLPATDGTNGQALVTNSTGTLSWATNSVSLTDNTTDAATHFVTLTTATSDTTITAVRRSSSKLTFQPSTGTLTSTAISTGTFTETSSIAYKENINPIEDALTKILQLTGVIYDRKDGSRMSEPGLLAEEVEKIIPNVITYKDGKVDGITYTKLTAYLVEAVKMLNLQIMELKGDRK